METSIPFTPSTDLSNNLPSSDATVQGQGHSLGNGSLTPATEVPRVPGHYGALVVMAAVTMTALVGNVCNILVIAKSAHLRNALSNFFVVSLCTSDLLAAIFVLPLAALTFTLGRWPLDEAVCQAAGFVSSLLMFVSMTTLCAISVERYYSIKMPMHHAAYMSLGKTLCAVFLVWIWAAVLAALPLLGLGSYTYNKHRYYCSFTWEQKQDSADLHKAYVVIVATLCFGAPGLVLLAMYAGIFRIAKTAATKIRPFSPGGTQHLRRSEAHRSFGIDGVGLPSVVTHSGVSVSPRGSVLVVVTSGARSMTKRRSSIGGAASAVTSNAGEMMKGVCVSDGKASADAFPSFTHPPFTTGTFEGTGIMSGAHVSPGTPSKTAHSFVGKPHNLTQSPYENPPNTDLFSDVSFLSNGTSAAVTANSLTATFSDTTNSVNKSASYVPNIVKHPPFIKTNTAVATCFNETHTGVGTLLNGTNSTDHSFNERNSSAVPVTDSFSDMNSGLTKFCNGKSHTRSRIVVDSSSAVTSINNSTSGMTQTLNGTTSPLTIGVRYVAFNSLNSSTTGHTLPSIEETDKYVTSKINESDNGSADTSACANSALLTEGQTCKLVMVKSDSRVEANAGGSMNSRNNFFSEVYSAETDKVEVSRPEVSGLNGQCATTVTHRTSEQAVTSIHVAGCGTQPATCMDDTASSEVRYLEGHFVTVHPTKSVEEPSEDAAQLEDIGCSEVRCIEGRDVTVKPAKSAEEPLDDAVNTTAHLKEVSGTVKTHSFSSEAGHIKTGYSLEQGEYPSYIKEIPTDSSPKVSDTINTTLRSGISIIDSNLYSGEERRPESSAKITNSAEHSVDNATTANSTETGYFSDDVKTTKYPIVCSGITVKTTDASGESVYCSLPLKTDDGYSEAPAVTNTNSLGTASSRGSDSSALVSTELSDVSTLRSNSLKPLRGHLKAAKTLLVLLAAYALLWGPFFVMHVHGVIYGRVDAPHTTEIVAQWLGFGSFAVNPLLYGWMNKTIREELIILYRRIFCSWCCCKRCSDHEDLQEDLNGLPDEDFFQFLERTSQACTKPISHCRVTDRDEEDKSGMLEQSEINAESSGPF